LVEGNLRSERRGGLWVHGLRVNRFV
jgi:hypothetical protein